MSYEKNGWYKTISWKNALIAIILLCYSCYSLYFNSVSIGLSFFSLAIIHVMFIRMEAISKQRFKIYTNINAELLRDYVLPAIHKAESEERHDTQNGFKTRNAG